MTTVKQFSSLAEINFDSNNNNIPKVFIVHNRTRKKRKRHAGARGYTNSMVTKDSEAHVTCSEKSLPRNGRHFVFVGAYQKQICANIQNSYFWTQTPVVVHHNFV